MCDYWKILFLNFYNDGNIEKWVFKINFVNKYFYGRWINKLENVKLSVKMRKIFGFEWLIVKYVDVIGC